MMLIDNKSDNKILINEALNSVTVSFVKNNSNLFLCKKVDFEIVFKCFSGMFSKLNSFVFLTMLSFEIHML